MNLTSPMLVGLKAMPGKDWPERLASAKKLELTELALFLADLASEERRELYRILEGSGIASIPYVQLPSSAEEWEPAYLSAKYATNVFSFRAEEKTYTLIAALPSPLPMILIENPRGSINPSVFSEQALQRPSVSGICLDAGALELQRLRGGKTYESAIATLDHYPVRCAFVSAIPEFWFGRLLGQKNKVTSLTDLHYLKHFPSIYFSGIVALYVDNSFEEQKEILAYLQSFFRPLV